ncbi:hypothetical protein [Serratia marcescens]|uniref:Morphogenetic protein n=1 Tax=Serratia marcescens TaxID=615 RepID=A0ABD5BC99_SERMA|nr:hypothetical protein [Serratia marcescens]MDQ9409497.1 hypothetical protein [Serratia marcescens]MDQ9533075.1 hypothetical protein [Serratia marcescens]MDQ9544536.1 hypothetical protein [Serratia marcescens]MDQ9554119.1 hypothetical protein [Serratia marcescens]MDQ9575671.1 hypothetical protein [Serratia marcescens]
MKERPVIFNGEMVRAILDGRKTQTRRVVSDRHMHLIDVASQIGECYPLESGINHANSQSYYRDLCPFGWVGDRLWVRETFAGHYLDDNQIQDIKDGRDKAEDLCEYRADYSDDADCVDGWTPSIHMPRWASRITLEITAVRVERLNDISEEDAKAEGVAPSQHIITPAEALYRVGFLKLWQSIYGFDSWNANPWVWVIEFRRVGGA